MWRSLREFHAITGRLVWAILSGIVFNIISFVQMFCLDFALGWRVSLAVCTLALLMVAFWAFHKMRVQRDQARLTKLFSPTREQLIEGLCKNLHVIGDEIDSAVRFDDIHAAIIAGAIVKQLRDLSAYQYDPLTEGQIDLAMRGQTLPQTSSKNPKDPAAQPEYQAFYAARNAAAKHLDGPSGTSPTPQNIKVGCHLIAADVRRACGLVKISGQ